MAQADSNGFSVATVVSPTITPTLGGSLTNADGTWTFGTKTAVGGTEILLNGASTGGFGISGQLVGGVFWTFTADNKWFSWTAARWKPQTAAPV